MRRCEDEEPQDPQQAQGLGCWWWHWWRRWGDNDQKQDSDEDAEEEEKEGVKWEEAEKTASIE